MQFAATIPENRLILLIFELWLKKTPFSQERPHPSTENLKIDEKMINFLLKIALNELLDRETCGKI